MWSLEEESVFSLRSTCVCVTSLSSILSVPEGWFFFFNFNLTSFKNHPKTTVVTEKKKLFTSRFLITWSFHHIPTHDAPFVFLTVVCRWRWNSGTLRASLFTDNKSLVFPRHLPRSTSLLYLSAAVTHHPPCTTGLSVCARECVNLISRGQ